MGCADLRLHDENKQRKLRILIADDHDVVRQGLRVLFEAEPGKYEVTAEARTGREAVEQAIQLKPDVVILDVSMPEMNGIEATRQIRAAAPKVEVLILTMHQSESMVEELLEAGARGYILKTDASRDVLEAVESLSRSRPFFTPSVAGMVLEGFLSIPNARHPHSIQALTARERETLQLLAEGRSNKEVASLFGVSIKTIETHRNNIKRKLRLRSISDLVHYAVREHIIQA